MQGFTPGLFDRLDADELAAPPAGRRQLSRMLEQCKRSVTRDLEALLNTRVALPAEALSSYPSVAGSVLNYGLLDFAGMCLTSDTDLKKICTSVRLAIERHEPRLHKISVTLLPVKGAINRVNFVITAELRSAPGSDPMSFNAIFQPSLQAYSINSAT